MPLSTKQIDLIHSPEFFFMPRVEGEDTIYDLEAEDTTGTNGALRSLKKRVYDGVAELRMYSDHIETWWNDIHVASADLIAQVWAGGAWQSQVFDFSTATITKLDAKTYRAVWITDPLENIKIVPVLSSGLGLSK